MIDITVQLLTCQYAVYPSWNHSDLAAPYWRIYWNGTRGWYVTYEGKCIELGPDKVIGIPPDTPFAARSTRGSAHLFIHFTSDFPFDRIASGIYTFTDIEECTHAVSALTKSLPFDNRMPLEKKARISANAHFLCYYILSKIPESELRIFNLSPKIRQATRILQENIGKPITNSMLAHALGMNTNAFIRLFHKETTYSPQVWFTARRIEHACRLLHHTEKGIDEIAAETGFCDRAHFSRVFRKYRGMGPGHFRQMIISLQKSDFL